MAGYKKRGRAVQSDRPKMPDLVARPEEPSPGDPSNKAVLGHDPLTVQQREQIVRRLLTDPAVLAAITVPTLPETTANEQIATTRFVGRAIDTEDASITADIAAAIAAHVAVDVIDGDAAGGDLTGTYPSPTIAALAVTDAKVATANKDGAAGTPSMRTLGTTATSACAGNDARLSDSRPPNGSAGGDLTGTYPNPTIKTSVALAGSPTTTTQSASDNSTKIATTAYVDAADALKANLASPALTGNPTAPTPSANDNDTSIATTAYVQTELGSMGTWTWSATAPGSPSDKDIWVYEDSSGVTWVFVYNAGSGSSYKWEFVGGPPIVVTVVTDETFTDDATSHDPATAGPTVTLPFAGDYIITAICDTYISAQSANIRGMGMTATASSGTWGITAATGSAILDAAITSGGAGVGLMGTSTLTGVSASATVKEQYYSVADTGTAHVRWRQIFALPIRVS